MCTGGPRPRGHPARSRQAVRPDQLRPLVEAPTAPVARVEPPRSPASSVRSHQEILEEMIQDSSSRSAPVAPVLTSRPTTLRALRISIPVQNESVPEASRRVRNPTPFERAAMYVVCAAMDVESAEPTSTPQNSQPLTQNTNEDTLPKCPICYDPFNTPKLLFCCGNSICQACEIRINETNIAINRNCQVCGSQGSGRQPLQVNVTLKSTLEMLRSLKSQATGHPCMECSKTVKLDEAYCCATCDHNKLICSHCAIKKHKNHDIQEFRCLTQEERNVLFDP
ncbi:hypothetical protein L596_022273 [Steinernema carpocapsae]|uniref:RING-type domain-containing protein n=1 Tax=Steinernema carpocapsae TaxID=34508 RepID=A0A4U5MLL6_STECR|nr:hypothetical protein L596_022273 [Steinernema carpocapsae]